MSDYVLGANEYELQRLRLQQEVWEGVTSDFLDRAGPLSEGVEGGARCLDVGCGPGFVVEMLRERIGPAGAVTALDESPLWMDYLASVCEERGWTNVELLRSRVQDAELEPAAYDLVFLRWVLSFLPEPGAVVEHLARALKPGGRMAVMDYNHEGLSLFPESEGFRAVIRGTRELYARNGGDTWIAARLPALFREAGLELETYEPYVLAGGPTSPAFRWADAFFSHHCHGMLEAGVITETERDLFLVEWEQRGDDPDAVFFSPIVVGAVARRG